MTTLIYFLFISLIFLKYLEGVEFSVGNMSHLSNYEKCVLNLPPSKVNISRFLYQPDCLHEDKQLHSINIPERCILGAYSWNYKVITNFYRHNVTLLHQNITFRSHDFNERLGLKKSWNLPSHKSTYGHSGDMLLLLLQYNIKELIFLGDSLLEQQSEHFLDCDLIRNHANVFDGHNVYFPLYDKYGSIVLHYIRPKANYNMILHSDKTVTYLHFLKNLKTNFKLYMNSSVPKVVIFDHGGVRLQNRNSMHSYATMYGVAQALSEFTLENPNIIILIREVSAQHFAYKRGGAYMSESRILENPNYVCEQTPIEEEQLGNRANPLLLDALNSIDISWRKRLGWIPFYNYSLEMYDLHQEIFMTSKKNDCTHWLYVPQMMDVIWYHARLELERLLKGRNLVYSS